MNTEKINIILDQEIWTDFLDGMERGEYDYQNFYQKITKNDILDEKVAEFGVIFTLKKDISGTILGKMVFGFENDEKIPPKIMEKWKKKLIENKKNIEFFGEEYVFSDSEINTGCGNLEFKIFEKNQKNKPIDIMILALKKIFLFFYETFENKQEKNIDIAVGKPSNKFGISYYSEKHKTLLPEWLLPIPKNYNSSLPDWLQNTENKDVDQAKHLENNLKNFNPDEIILSKSAQDEIDFLVKQYQNREHFEKFSASLPRGIVFYGPPGTGKTTIAKVIAHKLKMNFYFISSSEIFSKWMSESSINLRNFFEKIKENSLIFVDEIDGLLPGREHEDEMSGSTKERNNVVNVFLEYMDGMKSLKNVIFIGATNHIESLDKSALRAGRFDKKIFIPVPDTEARKKLWKMYLEKANKNSTISIIDEKTNFDTLAHSSYHFTGADIKEIVRRIMNDLAIFSLNNKQKITIKTEHIFNGILSHIEKYKEESSFDKGIIPEKEKFFLSDMGGQNELKTEIKKLVTQLKNREFFQEMNVALPKGMLLYGPPGTGKTLAAKIIANETGILFYMMRAKDFLGKNGVEDLEKKFSNFQSPSIVFIDEIDAIATHRRNMNQYGVQILNTLLQKMDGFNSSEGIFFIGATNNLDEIDEALLRAGRFDIKLKIDLPDETARAEIFKINIEKSLTRSGEKLFENNINYQKLSEKTEGVVGADIKEIIRRLTQKFAISLIENNENLNTRKISESEILAEINDYMENKITDRKIGFSY